MQRFKIYFFDIDGTLADSKMPIENDIAEKLAKLSIKDKIAIISGGNIHQIKTQVIEKLPQKAKINNFFLLPTSGGSLYVYRNDEWVEIYNNNIPEYKVKEIEKIILEGFKKNKIPIPRKVFGDRIEYRGSQITFSANGQNAPIEIKSKWDKNFRKRGKIIESVADQLSDFDIKIGGTNSIDINLSGINKSFGIRKMTEYLRVKPNQCLFVGDAIFVGGNDYAVIETGIKTISTKDKEDTAKILDSILKNKKYKDPKSNLFIRFCQIIWRFIKKIFYSIKCFFTNSFLLIKEKIHFIEKDKKEKLEPYLTRYSGNPILSPSSYSWEDEGVFNPAAIYLGGRVHLLYRALGKNGISTIGYASSPDGINFDERLSHPVYYPKADFEIDTSIKKENQKYNTDKYCSGGSWSGCEDPKLCQLEGRVFLSYVAFSGWKSVRIAMSSISVDDFLNKNWNWTLPVLCSPAGVISKSGGLFPEKIRGKYVFFQRIFPNILIDYIDNLRFDSGYFPNGEHNIPPRKKGWDSRKISFGSTPIKTKYGWLVVTHGVDDAKDDQYHLGIMLLDLNNPEKVLYRSDVPLLSPELWYENDWKPGIIYPCGAVNKDGTLLIYYGGGDKYVCVASAPFDDFVESIVSDSVPKLKINRLKI